MIRWLITIVIVLVLATLALSAPWWLPELLVPYLGDPFLVESGTTLVQLILCVLAGLSAILGIRWAIRGRRSGYQVLTADDLEAARARATASTLPEEATEAGAETLAGGETEEGGDEPEEPEAVAPDEPAETPPVESAVAPPDEPAAGAVKQDNDLTESLFGSSGALAAGRLTPSGSQPPDDTPSEQTSPEFEETLSQALFGPDGPLPAGSLVPVGPLAGAGMDQEPGDPELRGEAGPEPGWEPSPVAVGPLPAAEAGRFNLPADLPHFFGRQTELGQLRQYLLQDPGSSRQTLSISSLAGMAGVGKTALALHLAHGLAAEGRFRDAHLYVDLKGSSTEPLSPAAALEALLTALLGPEPKRPHDADTLAHLWRAALQDRRVLLLLDDAAGAAQVRPLLPGSADCAVLITSQQRFALPGAGRLDLEPLGQEDARAFLQSLAPRIENEEVSQIARQCGGLPLALRIAGSYLVLNDDLSPVAYAAHMADEDTRLELLRDPGEPDLDVGATLVSSIDRLSGSMRRAWAMLAYLPAPFDVAAASALWGEGSAEGAWQRLDVGLALDRLRMLRNGSLLSYSPLTGLYGQQVLLRLAASRELTRLGAISPGSGDQAAAWPDQADEACLRVARHFLEIARSADEAKRYAELDPEWTHLRTALEYANKLDADLFSELVQVLNPYWSAMGMVREQAVWNDLAARASADAGRQEAEGLHLAALGAAYDELGEPEQAIEAYGRAVRASRQSGNQDAEAHHLQGVGWAYQELGDVELAMQYYRQALDLYRETANAQGESVSLGCLGRALAAQGDHRRAIGNYQQAVALAHEAGDRQAEGTWLGDLSLSYAELGDAHKAVATRECALALARAAGNRHEEADHLAGLGDAYALLDETATGPQPAGPQSFSAQPAPAGSDPRTLGTDPRTLGTDPRTLGTDPRTSGTQSSRPSFSQDAVGADGPLAEPRAWGEEIELTPIRQILLPMPRGIEVWNDSPFPPDLDLADVADQPAAVEDGESFETCGDDVDLCVQDIWSTTTPLTPGSWETIAYRIKNQGTESTCRRFYVRMWFDSTLIRTWYVDGLGAGRTAIGWVQVNVNEPGSHEIRVHADCSSGVAEAELENNVRTETWFWGEAPDAPAPSARPGALSGADVEAQLAGPEPLLSEWGAEGELAGIRQIMLPSLQGVDVRSSQDPQSQRIGWDPSGGRPAGQADLVVQDIWSTYEALAAGDWTTIAFRLLNQGTLSISARFYVRMWLDGEVAGTWYMDGLEAGGTAVGWLQVRVREAGEHEIKIYADYGDAVPEANEENNRRVETWSWSEEAGASNDAGPSLANRDPEAETLAALEGPVPIPHDWGEEGELLSVRQAVSPSVPGIDFRGDQAFDEAQPRSRIGVDLMILEIWSPTTPLEAQGWETVAFRIQNQGTDDAHPRFYTRMWFDRTVIRTWYVDGLKAGATGIGWVQMRVAEPGSHGIRIQLDVTNAVAEADEENNVRSETWIWYEPQLAQPAEPPVSVPPEVSTPGSGTVIVGQKPFLGSSEAPVEGESGVVGLGQLPSPGASVAGQAQAREAWTEALEIFQEMGDPRSEEMRSRLDALDD